jgi:hypothetical protein
MNEQESKENWKVFLEPNKLTENPNDFTAIVSTAGDTRTIGDIVRQFGVRGTEFQLESIESLLLQGNRIISDFLLAGYAVNTGLVTLHPRVTGPWEGNEPFTEGKHKVKLDLGLDKSLREALKKVGVEVIGEKDSGARITLVTDRRTGRTDGFFSIGDDLLIVGEKIKVVGLPQPDGSLEPGIGVFFVPDNGGAPQQVRRIDENTNSRILARVDISTEDGAKYRLRIVTRYSTGTILLKEPRTIEYRLLMFRD